jgi:hypothetical protein
MEVQTVSTAMRANQTVCTVCPKGKNRMGRISRVTAWVGSVLMQMFSLCVFRTCVLDIISTLVIAAKVFRGINAGFPSIGERRTGYLFRTYPSAISPQRMCKIIYGAIKFPVIVLRPFIAIDQTKRNISGRLI